MDRRTLWMIAALLPLAGCSGGDAPAYRSWASASVSTPGPGSRYAGYCRAADLAEKIPAELAGKVSYSPDRRGQLLAKLAPAFAELSRAQRAPGGPFEVTSASDGKTPKHHLGWVLIGRGLAFRIEQSIDAGNFDRAIADAVRANRLGFDLCAGDAIHASLGLSIAAEARTALAKGLDSMSASQLSNLSKQFAQLLESKPSMLQTLDGEDRRMMAELQFVQDAFIRNRVRELAKLWNVPERNLAALKKLAKQDGKEKLAFFEGLAKELHERTAYWEQLIGLPTRLRDPKQGRVKPFEAKPEAPWSRVAGMVASGGETVILQNDEAIARTRLLVAQARLMALAKAKKPLPRDLANFGEAGVDPYTGRLMAYRADAGEFRVYSAGPNGIDDGGQTDESGTFPDVCLSGM